MGRIICLVAVFINRIMIICCVCLFEIAFTMIRLLLLLCSVCLYVPSIYAEVFSNKIYPVNMVF